jgi:fructokinase
VYFGTLGQRGITSRNTIRRVLEVAQERGIPRVLDINLRPPFFTPELLRESIALASVVKLSDEEIETVCSACDVPIAADVAQSVAALREKFSLDLVCLTRGAAGAYLVSRSASHDQAGVPTTVVDTVGAGDSFTAALTLGLLRGQSLAEIAAEACRVASTVCSHAGALPPLFQA